MEIQKGNRLLKTAIVILNWNGLELLPAYLPGVVGFSHDKADIYVIDNCSTDDSVNYIRNTFPTIKIIQNEKNYGFAEGYNIGLKHVEADIYCLLNSDVEVTENWLDPIINLFETNPEIAAVQPKILNATIRNKFEYAGAAGGFVDNLGYPFCRGRVFWDLEEDHGQYNDVIPVFWATGACLFIRKTDFDNVNGFDTDYFAHMEEIDLCWRLNNLGRKIYYCGLSTVYHLGGGTLKNNSPRKTYLNFRNSLFTILKNLPIWIVFPIVFIRLCLDGISALVFWKYESFSHLKAIFWSHMHFYRDFFRMFKKRNSTIKNYGHKHFVALQYFVLKKKKYNELK